jgi:hypothetical protein
MYIDRMHFETFDEIAPVACMMSSATKKHKYLALCKVGDICTPSLNIETEHGYKNSG